MRALLLLLSSVALAACSSAETDDVACVAAPEAAMFTVDGTEVVLNGSIDCSTEPRLLEVLNANPSITTLRLDLGPGSDDDEANLKLGRMVHARGLNTRVPDYSDIDTDGDPEQGLIASGAVDLFLAGRTRTLGSMACVGVHSWAAEDGLEGGDLPDDDPEHDPYLSYFRDIGYAQGEAFYFYTLDVASADGITYMTPDDLRRFNMTTEPIDGTDCPLPDERS